MKVLLAALMLFSFTASAETKEANEKKAEMVNRALDLRLVAETAEELFEAQEYSSACESVDELLRGLPAHLNDLHSSVDGMKKMKKESVSVILDAHKLHNRCKDGKDHQYVDAKKARKQMKQAAKKIKRHATLIEDKYTGQSYPFKWGYSF